MFYGSNKCQNTRSRKDSTDNLRIKDDTSCR